MVFSAIVLDMDGLMLDTEVLYRRAWQEAARGLGFELSDAMYSELIGLGRADAELQVSRWFGASFPIRDFASSWERRWEADTRLTLPAKPGLFELLDWIDSEGIPVAVATSTEAEYAQMSLGKAGVASRIRCVVTGDQVTARKPAPDLFLEAARRLGVQPEACVAAEDSDAGIAAAHRAGMRAIMVPDLKPPSAQSVALAWRICPTLHDVQKILALERQPARPAASADVEEQVG